jgi:predicted Zn-dependent protease
MRAWSYRLLLVGACLFSCAITTAAKVALGQAQVKLVAPREVALYVHAEFKNTAFIEPLVCSLRRVLVAPVEARTLSLSLDREMLATPTHFDAVKVAEKFGRATATADSRTFRYFLMPYPIKNPRYPNPASTGFGKGSKPYHIGVIATARLEESIDPSLSQRARAELIALRTYKVLIKLIVENAGMPDDLQHCVLAQSRNLEDLDRKPAEFCPQDQATLVEAGILKAKESDGCFYVSEIRDPGLNSILAPRSEERTSLGGFAERTASIRIEVPRHGE